LTGDQTFYRLQNPEDSDCDTTSTFYLTGISFVVCYVQACTTQISMEIYESDGNPCPQPGNLIYSTGNLMLAVAEPPAWNCPTFFLDLHDTIAVSGSFFIGYTLPDSVNCFETFVDDFPGPCISYTFRNNTLHDLNNHSFPGQLWIYSHGIDAVDSDGDGLHNGIDVCPNDPLNDADGDNICDSEDNCLGLNNPLQLDDDLDNIGNLCDNCPNDYNSGQSDVDGDGIGDACDTCTDTDGDGFGNPGYPANTCPDDNCPTLFNPGQDDTNGNDVGDLCDYQMILRMLIVLELLIYLMLSI